MRYIFTLLILAFTPLIGFAEQCGISESCVGKIGYIVIPESHHRYSHGQKGKYNGKPFIVNATDKFLTEDGIPFTGNEYTINTSYTELLEGYDFTGDLAAVGRWFEVNNGHEFITESTGSYVELLLQAVQFYQGDQLMKGSIVKVLNVRLLSEEVPNIHRTHLLLLVQVISEP